MKFPSMHSTFGLFKSPSQGYTPVAAPYHDKEPRGSDEEMLHGPIGQKTPKRSVWKVVALCLSCATLSAIITGAATRKVYIKTQEPLIRTPIPDFPKEIRYFEWDSTYVEEPNEENNKAWDELLPGGRGFVYVKDSASYDLEPGLQSKWGEIYSVAMFHQMHCLGVIRQNYWRLVRGVLDHDESLYHEAEVMIETSHTGHCFDYFRQSIECSADMALEWPRTEADGRRFQVDGEGIPHVCASKAALKEYMDAYHFNGSRVHDIAA
ncbi:hypothetical protein F4806DRAFT_66601 [Annulohypoxylon nitens]|nr:hypothetical protein F4806DRAFT_66601 [Annulohypoxylon nitens]